jgi:protein-tyrosine-phosphatase
MPSILFICTVNRFRSPLAEVIFRSECSKRGLDSAWQVGSAGTWTEPGLLPMPDAISFAQVMGLDLTSHRSRLVNADLMHASNLILVMESGQKEALVFEFPASAKKVVLLSEAVGGVAYDIPDPYSSEEPALEVAKELYKMIRDGFDMICQLAENVIPVENKALE